MQLLSDQIGPYLFYMAMVLAFISPEWFCNTNVPQSLLDAWPIVPQSVRALCGIRLLLLASRHPRYVAACAVALVLLVVSFKMCGDKLPFMTALLVFSSRDTDYRRIVSIGFVALLTICVIAVVSYAAGITGDLVKHRFGLIGHSWGIGNPNTLAIIMGLTTVQALFLAKVRDWRKVCLVCTLMAVLAASLTLGMTMVVVLLLLPWVYYAMQRFSLPQWLCYGLPWLGLAVSILLMFYYGSSSGETTFESRFSMAAMVYERNGISMFGQDYGPVSWMQAQQTGEEPFYLDNMYLSLLVYYGVIPMAIMLGLMGFGLSRLARYGNRLLLSMFLTLLVASLMEAIMLRATMNFMLFFAFAAWTGNLKQENVR